MTDQERADLIDLIGKPGFLRFLFRTIQSSGIFDATANGSDGRNLYLEGRRSLGLQILREVDEAQPVPSPSGIPILTLIQVLREEAQSNPRETTNGRRSDTYSELDRPDASG